MGFDQRTMIHELLFKNKRRRLLKAAGRNRQPSVDGRREFLAELHLREIAVKSLADQLRKSAYSEILAYSSGPKF